MDWKLDTMRIVYNGSPLLMVARVCISARSARAMTLCFHFKLSIEYASKKIRYDFSNCFYNRLYIVAMVLNYSPQKFLKSRYGPSLKKDRRPWIRLRLAFDTCFSWLPT